MHRRGMFLAGDRDAKSGARLSTATGTTAQQRASPVSARSAWPPRRVPRPVGRPGIQRSRPGTGRPATQYQRARAVTCHPHPETALLPAQPGWADREQGMSWGCAEDSGARTASPARTTWTAGGGAGMVTAQWAWGCRSRWCRNVPPGRYEQALPRLWWL